MKGAVSGEADCRRIRAARSLLLASVIDGLLKKPGSCSQIIWLDFPLEHHYSNSGISIRHTTITRLQQQTMGCCCIILTLMQMKVDFSLLKTCYRITFLCLPVD